MMSVSANLTPSQRVKDKGSKRWRSSEQDKTKREKRIEEIMHLKSPTYIGIICFRLNTLGQTTLQVTRHKLDRRGT